MLNCSLVVEEECSENCVEDCVDSIVENCSKDCSEVYDNSTNTTELVCVESCLNETVTVCEDNCSIDCLDVENEVCVNESVSVCDETLETVSDCSTELVEECSTEEVCGAVKEERNSGGFDRTTSSFDGTTIHINSTGNDLNTTYTDVNDDAKFNEISTNVYEFLLPVNIYGDMVFEVNKTGFGFNDGYGTNPCTTGGGSGGYGWTTLRVTEPINVFGSLTIEPGVVIKFDNDSYIQAKTDGKIKSIGNVSGDNRCWVTYTSIHDNLTGYGYTQSDGKAYAGVYDNAIILDADASNYSSIEFSKFYYANTSINVYVPRMNYSWSSTAPYGVRNGDIVNNQFKENVVGILLSTPINVTNNLFYGIYDYGIKVLSSVSSGLYMSYNTFDGCGATGYGAYGCAHTWDGKGYGILFDGTTGGGYGNLFANLAYGLREDSGTLTVDYNAYFNNTLDADQGSNKVDLAVTPFDGSANHSYFILGSSPSTDAGSDTVGNLGFSSYYTGNEFDTGTADIGYHYSFTADSGVAVSFVSPTPSWTQNHTGWGQDYIINCSATTIALNDLDNISFYDTTGSFVGTTSVSGQSGWANWTITNLQAGTKTVTCQACDNVTCVNSTKMLQTGVWQDMDLSLAAASFIGEDASDSSGYSVSYAGDVNGDGYDDMIIGAVGDEDGGNSAGQSYLIYGGTGLTQDMDLSSANASFIGEDASSPIKLALALLKSISCVKPVPPKIK